METHPFIELRQKIRKAGRQFRRNNDNSNSIFHPTGGFIYGYDMTEVEDALDAYEGSLPTEFQASYRTLTIEEKLIKEAQQITTTNGDIDIRDFARSVVAYLVINADPQRRRNPMPTLRVELTKPEKDLI